MAQIPYTTHHDLVKDRATRFEELLRRGAFAPLLLQYAIGTSILLLLPLVIRHRTVSQSIMLRYGFHAVITAFCAYTIIQVRLLGPGNGYGVGLITTWFYIWSTTILLANDVQKDFRRIIKEPEIVLGTGKHQIGTSTGVDQNIDDLSLKHRSPERQSNASLDLLQLQELPKRYKWQPFPQKLSDRLDWTLDLIFNFRGPNWNWRLKSLPPLPEAIINDLKEQHLSRSTTRQLQQMDVDKLASMKLRKVLIHFARDYMILDLLKITLMRDPYFWGYVDKPLSTSPWPFVILTGYPVLIRSYRIVLSLLSVLYALKVITALNPLFFMGLSYIFPRLARAVSRQPLGEAWLYLDAFGPATSILDQGLVGAWNIWWHQLFRFGFSECSRFLTDLILPGNALEKKKKHSLKQARLALQVMLAFSLSGLVHALGSYTTFSNARPWDSFLFFFLQGLGTITQYIFQSTVVPAIFPKKSTTSSQPRWLIRLVNFVVIVLWFYFTGPLIADDFARVGIWTFEPIPLSLLRGGLGMGVEGDGWRCWKGSWFKWYEGDTWWRSGIRIV